MADIETNPLGLDGFEFCEFTSPDPRRHGRPVRAARLRRRPHAIPRARHRALPPGPHQPAAEPQPEGQAAEFRAAHGPSANGMAFRVANADAEAYEAALDRGAKPADAASRRARRGLARAGGDRRLEPLPGRPAWGGRRAVRRLDRGSRLARGGGAERCRPRPARPPHPQRAPRRDAHLVGASTASCSASRSRSISTSRARPPACSARR